MTRFDSDPSQDSTTSSDCDESPVEHLIDAVPPQTILETVPEPTPVLTIPLSDYNGKEERKNDCLTSSSAGKEKSKIIYYALKN